MSELHLNISILITCISIISLVICYVLDKQLYSAATFYWSAWVFSLVSVEIISRLYLYPYHTNIGIDLLIKAHLGAALGFALGSFLYRYSNKSCFQFTIYDIRGFIKKYDRKLMVLTRLYLGIGFISFLRAYLISGGSIYDIRMTFLETSYDPWTQITNYVMTSSLVLLVIYAWEDSTNNSIKWKRLIFLLVGLSCQSLSMGGRIFIAISIITYVTSFVLTKNICTKRMDFRVKLRILFVVISIFTCFSIIGILRSDDVSKKINSTETILRSTLLSVPSYVSDSVVAIGPHSYEALNCNRTCGLYTFDAIYRILSRIQVVDGSNNAYDHFNHEKYQHKTIDLPIGWTQTNSIPKAVCDFGEKYFMLYFIIACFVSQLISLKYKCRNLFLHILSVWMCVCSAYSIQSAHWFCAQSMFLLVFGWTFEKVFKYNLGNMDSAKLVLIRKVGN